MAEFFALCEAYVGAKLAHVYNENSEMAIVKKTDSNTLYVRSDGIVIASMVNRGGGRRLFPIVPRNPAETEYAYLATTIGVTATYTHAKTKFPFL